MTRHQETPRLPDAAPPAGEATSTGRVGASAAEGPGLVCECKHLDVLHDISKTTKRRTACSVSCGPKAAPCGCKKFDPSTQENPS